MVEKGVNWKVGKVFFKDDLVYSFDLLPEPGHKMPAMINLQQYYSKKFGRSLWRDAVVDLRWKHKLISLAQEADHATLTIETPDGIFKLEADWVIACDGANSDTRRLVGGEFTGQFFQDRFLIADVVMKAEFPTERWFWFDPLFHQNQSVLLHKQCDDVWRIDFQLGWDANPDEEKKPENVIPRFRRCWARTSSSSWNGLPSTSSPADGSTTSVTAACCSRATPRTRCRRSGREAPTPGVQDIDNLIWKLKLVLTARPARRSWTLS